jgi:hypothetical protein
MRKLLVLALVLGLAGVAIAADTGNQMPIKSTPVYPDNPVDPDRQGGDTIFDATVIPGLPYSDTGTTAGYVNDYDEVCPYSGSTAADVVYVYTAAVSEPVDIDLCGSSYDTKLYVYDAGLALVACNDDFYGGDPCGLYVSKLENVALTAGQTYYIVIDGYGTAFGAYVLDISGFVPCILECPAGAMLEGEPDPYDGYYDTYNGGCNADGTFQELQGDNVGNLTFCGVSGWYNQGTYRDTDWFWILMGPTGAIDVTVDAEYPTYIFELSPQDCASVAVLQLALGGPCAEAYMTITGYAECQVVWFWAGPSAWEANGTYDYTLWFSGLCWGTATENTSWSNVKALFE